MARVTTVEAEIYDGGRRIETVRFHHIFEATPAASATKRYRVLPRFLTTTTLSICCGAIVFRFTTFFFRSDLRRSRRRSVRQMDVPLNSSSRRRRRCLFVVFFCWFTGAKRRFIGCLPASNGVDQVVLHGNFDPIRFAGFF